MKPDVLHARVAHRRQFLDQCESARARAEAMPLQRFVWIVGEVEMDEGDVGLVARDRSPCGGAPLMIGRRAGIGEATVRVRPDPLRRLLCETGDKERNRCARRRQHLDAGRQMTARAVAQQCDLRAEIRTPRVEVAAEQRILDWPVAACDAEQQAAAAQCVDRRGRLQREHRLAQRQHDGGCAQQDIARDAGEEAEIGKHLEDLCRVAERRIVERHVADPECAETERIRQFGQFSVDREIRHAGMPSVTLTLRVAGRRPVVVERQFDANAEASARQSFE
jgi:hypothetical protein